jgi:phosphopantetheinyl transferase
MFRHRARGKPYLCEPEVPGLDFNTTHEGTYVLLAVAHGTPGATDVGVDVMDLPAEPDELASSVGFQGGLHEGDGRRRELWARPH